MANKTILIMFLGEGPENKLLDHYIKINATFTHKNNVYVVFHPKELSGELNARFKELFNPDNLFKVHESHHMKTVWFSHSVTCAQLMMIQYSHNKKKETDRTFTFFDKYILLSATCAPLYSFDYIYTKVTSHTKSYIQPMYDLITIFKRIFDMAEKGGKWAINCYSIFYQIIYYLIKSS